MAGTTHRSFGYLRKLPSKRWHASYVGPDRRRYNAPTTYTKKVIAEGWLADRQRDIDSGAWTPQNATGTSTLTGPKVVLFGRYATAWLAGRNLKPATRALYGRQLKNYLHDFEEVPVKYIDAPMVREWYAGMAARNIPTARAHSYALLRTILKDAVTDGLLPSNPCVIRAAGNTKTVKKIKPATLAELEVIVENMPEKYHALLLICAWGALRFGEVTELRRKDIDIATGKIEIRRGVVQFSKPEGGMVWNVDTPKTGSSIRDVTMPPHLIPVLRHHMEKHVLWDQEALLFPSASDPNKHLSEGTLAKTWRRAREKAGRPDLNIHALRHTGAVLAASTGATLAELMARLGHSTVGAAMRYQHAALDRDAIIAAKLSELVALAR